MQGNICFPIDLITKKVGIWLASMWIVNQQKIKDFTTTSEHGVILSMKPIFGCWILCQVSLDPTLSYDPGEAQPGQQGEPIVGEENDCLCGRGREEMGLDKGSPWVWPR